MFQRKRRVEKMELSVQDYDATYNTVLHVMKYVGIRLMRNDSRIVKLLCDTYYWSTFFSLLWAFILEGTQIAVTARGGTFDDAVEIFIMMPCIGYVVLGVTKSFTIVYYRPVYENIVRELREMWPRRHLDDEELSILRTVLKELRIVIKCYFWCNNALIAIFFLPALLNRVQYALGLDVPLIHPFYYWFPFNAFQNGVYDVVLLLQIWQGSSVVWLLVCSDMLFCIFLGHITMQFDLLSYRIRKYIHVPTDQQLLKSYPLGKLQSSLGSIVNDPRQTEPKYLEELSNIVQKHQKLIRLSRDVEKMFSFSLLVNFLNSSIVICFCGFCCVVVEKLTDMTYKSFLITALSQTYLLCWYGQRLLDASTGVSDSLYNSGWYKTSRKVRSSILIMIHRAQKEVHVTTFGFSVISLSSFTTIIKTSWSYFTLLLNIYKK